MIQRQGGISRTTLFLSLGWAFAVWFLVVALILLAKNNRLSDEVSRAGSKTASLARDLESERRWTAALTAPGVRTASFTLTPSGDAALRARATVDPETHRALLVFQNFRAPDGHAYTLWALRGNTPVALGRIEADPSGRTVMRLEDMGDPSNVSAFAISLEPAPTPSAPAPSEPTGPIVMIGSLGG